MGNIERILVFVEDETWLKNINSMFHKMIGENEITKCRIMKGYVEIQSTKFHIDIVVGLHANSRGRKADIVLNLVHHQMGNSADDLQNLHLLIPIMMTKSKYVTVREGE